MKKPVAPATPGFVDQRPAARAQQEFQDIADSGAKPAQLVEARISTGRADVVQRKGGVAVASAGAGGDPPRNPKDDKFLTGHYAETGPLPVKELDVEMARKNRFAAFMDPGKRSQTDMETRGLALDQTRAARNLLYRPGATLRSEIGLAAQALLDVINGLEGWERAALGARLLGSEGLLPGESPDAIYQALGRLVGDMNEPGTASATDRAVMMALMGDIGALYADTGATTGVEGRSSTQADFLRAQLQVFLAQRALESPHSADIARVQGAAGSRAVGPRKKHERVRPPNEKPSRSGIHDLGEMADDQLGIAEAARLPGARWDVAHINRFRVATTREPLVGHMSGSPAEILQVWDLLRGERREGQFTSVMEQQQQDPVTRPMERLAPAEQNRRYARAAGAGAFLVGLGFHSALEVAEGSLAYTGQSVRSAVGDQQDAGHLMGQGAATDLISDLFEGQTETD